MAVDSSTKPLDIGIIGGGLAGSFAAVALGRLPNTKITVYEKSPAATEVGAWISLTNATFDVLTRFIDSDKLNGIAFRGDPNNEYVTRHWKTGEIIYTQETFNRSRPFVEARTHRIPLHNLILEHVPSNVEIKYDSNVASITSSPEGITINAKYDKKDRHDLVVVADGIYSRIRQQFFPKGAIKYKGVVAYRSVFPESLVSHITDLPSDTSVWAKSGSVVFLSKLGLGQYGVVAIISEPEATAGKLKWNRGTGEWGRKRLKEFFDQWDSRINQVIQIVPEILAFPLESGPWLSNLVVDDQIAFIGDAAHPTSGVYGAGASFGFSDAWALYRSLQETSSNHWVRAATVANKYNIKLALFLFNETRRYFLQRVEKQIAIDAEVGRDHLSKAKDDKEWTDKYLIVRSGGEWMRSHNVELEYQKVRDQYSVLLQRNLTSFQTLGHGLTEWDIPKL
ncbi:salicylate hydroxylase [Scheffersomyces xylosifermentans]|uniref:salicylate hydroxylase n=1 Tax=Scheffersomyces xylosifermentans TaxID=1304137 RepID=UPI00315C7E53